MSAHRPRAGDPIRRSTSPLGFEALFAGGATGTGAKIARVVFENTSDIIHVLDHEARIAFVSASVQRILGYDPEELIGRVGHDLVHPDDRAHAERTFEESIDHVGSTRDVELRLRHRDGSWRTFAVVGRIVGDSPEEAIAVVTSTDITERKRAEDQLRRTGEVLRAIVQASPLPILMLDTEGCVQMWNRAAEDVFGWSAEEVLGRGLPYVPAEAEEEHRKLRERALRGEVFEGVEAVRRRKNGERITVSLFTAPVSDAAGQIIGTMAVVEDVTQRKRHEQLRAQVLQFVSHDLRSPLSGILFAASHAQMLAGAEQVPREIPKLLDGIVRSAEEMNALIRDISDATRIDAGGLMLEVEVSSAEALLRDAATMYRPVARERRILIEVNAAPGLFVRADRHRILQVLSNLIGNALRFTPEEGRILLGVEEAGCEVCFSVADTGRGIPETDLPNIFNRFWQRDPSTPGTAGLGLTIARGIVEAHGGRIRAESRVGEGSVFYFALPRGELPSKEAGNGAASL